MLIKQAGKTREAAQRLPRLLDGIRLEQIDGAVKPAPRSDQSLFGAAKPAPFAHVKAQLAQAEVFIAKCVRDLPRILAKTGFRSTVSERERIYIATTRIALGAELIMMMAEQGLCGTVRRPDGSGRDRLGVGKRYAPWLDPLVDRVPALAGYSMPKSPNFQGVAHAQQVRRRPKQGKSRRRRNKSKR